MFYEALSHIYVSAAYRSRIYANFETLRPEPKFVRATYVPCTCDVPATFSRICIRMEIHFRMYSVTMRMCYVRVAYVWLMKCTCDVSTAHVLCICSVQNAFKYLLICGVSVLYKMLFNTYENKQFCSLCSDNSHITVIKYQRSKMPPEKSR